MSIASLKWAPQVLNLEIKGLLSYRVDFWVRTLATGGFSILVAYFLWSSIFASSGKDSLGGYDLQSMLVYYLFGALIFQVIQPPFGQMAREIYDGSLTKYLVYPLSFFQYRFISHVANGLLIFIQLIAVVLLIWILLPEAGLISFDPILVLAGCASLFLGSLLYFTMSALLELVAFWIDSVWTLLVTLRFFVQFFGGKLIPLALFPLWASDILYYTPFPSLLSFPIRCFLGRTERSEILPTFLILSIWLGIFLLCWVALWRKGLKQYSGVGQ